MPLCADIITYNTARTHLQRLSPHATTNLYQANLNPSALITSFDHIFGNPSSPDSAFTYVLARVAREASKLTSTSAFSSLQAEQKKITTFISRSRAQLLRALPADQKKVKEGRVNSFLQHLEQILTSNIQQHTKAWRLRKRLLIGALLFLVGTYGVKKIVDYRATKKQKQPLAPVTVLPERFDRFAQDTYATVQQKLSEPVQTRKPDTANPFTLFVKTLYPSYRVDPTELKKHAKKQMSGSDFVRRDLRLHEEAQQAAKEVYGWLHNAGNKAVTYAARKAQTYMNRTKK